jgi:hypothetical protein
MEKNRRLSDQLLNWSDNDKASSQFASATRQSHWAASVYESGVFTGVANRALQEVWQAWMQVCERARTRSQILPFVECFWSSSRDDLRASAVRGASTSLSWKSCGRACAFRRDLRNKLRAFEKPGRLSRVNIWRRVQLLPSRVLICPRLQS